MVAGCALLYPDLRNLCAISAFKLGKLSEALERILAFS